MGICTSCYEQIDDNNQIEENTFVYENSSISDVGIMQGLQNGFQNVDWAKANNYEMPDKSELLATLEQCSLRKSRRIFNPEGYFDDLNLDRDIMWQEASLMLKSSAPSYAVFNGICAETIETIHKIKKLTLTIDGKIFGTWNQNDLEPKMIKPFIVIDNHCNFVSTTNCHAIELMLVPLPNRSLKIKVTCDPSNLENELYIVGTHIHVIEDRWHIRELAKQQFP